MKKNKQIHLLLMTLLAAVFIFGQTLSVFASAPAIKKVEYEGKGKVEVDFTKRVTYRNVKVTVTDTKGNKYTATVIDKDTDDLEFRIPKYRTGRTYTFKISGVKVKGTSGYGTISGTVKIPKNSSAVSKSKAVSLAEDHARTALNVTRIRKAEAEKDTFKGKASWDIEFEGKIGNKWYEFDYDVSRSSGKILSFRYELDS